MEWRTIQSLVSGRCVSVNDGKLASIAQLIASFAVLIWLILVVWELRQSHEIAQIQQQTATFETYNAGVRSIMGENPSASIAKSCTEPQKLTVQDMTILDAVYVTYLNRMRAWLLSSEVSENITVTDWKRWQSNFDFIFATDYGRYWWSHAQWEPEVMEIGNRVLAESGPVDCVSYYHDFLRQFEEDLDDA